MLEPGREPHLAAEAVDVDPTGEIGRQHLHDDRAPERRLGGDEDAAHPATAELLLERIGGTECALQLVAQLRHRRPSSGDTRSYRRRPVAARDASRFKGSESLKNGPAILALPGMECD